MNPNTSLPKIDVTRLRNDLLDYYKTELYNGFSAAQTEITRIQKASDEEIIITAQEEGFDLNAYASNPNLTETKKQTIPSSQKSQENTQAVSANNEISTGQILTIVACVMGGVFLISSISEMLVGIIGIILFVLLIFVAVPMIKDWIKEAPERKKKAEEEERARKEEERRRNMAFLEAAMGLYSTQRSTPSYTSTTSTPTINTTRLRNDMMNYYGTAMHSGSPMAQADLVHVQRASDAELIREAQKSGFDLNKYTE